MVFRTLGRNEWNKESHFCWKDCLEESLLNASSRLPRTNSCSRLDFNISQSLQSMLSVWVLIYKQSYLDQSSWSQAAAPQKNSRQTSILTHVMQFVNGDSAISQNHFRSNFGWFLEVVWLRWAGTCNVVTYMHITCERCMMIKSYRVYLISSTYTQANKMCLVKLGLLSVFHK